jgi:hypothetical protein
VDEVKISFGQASKIEFLDDLFETNINCQALHLISKHHKSCGDAFKIIKISSPAKQFIEKAQESDKGHYRSAW